MPTPRDIVEPRQLGVGGHDAELFFTALLRQNGLVGMQVQNCGGITELPAFLRALRLAPRFATVASLGVIRDAEADPRAAFQSVCSALRNAQLVAPRRPNAPGAGSPRTAVLILPNATAAGMLETICLEAVAHDPVMECVDRFLDCVAQKGLSPGNLFKARVHAFLASRAKPDLQLGEAAHAGYWPWDSPAFDHIKRFLQAL